MRGAATTPLHLTVKTQVKNITHVLHPSYYSQMCHIILLIKFFLKFILKLLRLLNLLLTYHFPAEGC